MSATRRTVPLGVQTLEDRRTPAATVSAPDSNGIVSIICDDSADRVVLTQSGGRYRLNGQMAIDARQVRGFYIDGNGGGDYIDARGSAVPVQIYGGSGHDTLIGGMAGDYLDGQSNDDRLFGVGGNDTLAGGTADDRLFGGAGYDYLYGNEGDDFMDDGTKARHEFYSDAYDGDQDYIADMFAPAGITSPAHIKQGSQSYNCTFLSTLAAMSQSGVSFRTYINYRGYNNDGVGQYDVKVFNGQRWVITRVLFEGHTNQADAQKTVDYASWPIIMNRAWCQVYGNTGQATDVGLRGMGYRTVKLALNSNKDFDTIAYALANRRPVVCGTGANVSMNVLEDGHAYQVVQAGWYNGSRWVQVRNPWGYDHTRATEGDNDGLIWMTWEHFAYSMSSASIG